MTIGYLFVGLAYAALTLGVLLFERRRTRSSGIDFTTIFTVLTLLQCCIPAALIFLMLPFVSGDLTDNYVFNNILLAANMTTALAVLGLTVFFMLFLYCGYALGRLALSGLRGLPRAGTSFTLEVVEWRIVAVLGGGLALTLATFFMLGDNLTQRFANLILFRAGFEGIERNALNANAFALTQSWSFLSVVVLCAVYERRGRGLLWLACLAGAVILALLGVSRRGIALPILLGYLAWVLARGKWRLRWVVAAAAPLMLWLAIGKELFSKIAGGRSLETLGSGFESWAAPVLRAASDAGLTVLESLGTLTFLHLPMRFGVDHLLSMAQRFPEGMLGWDFNFPERIVRVSTAAFHDAYAQDLPPGLLGQMWLDFGIFGPVVWGLAFGLQVAVLQWFYERTRPTLTSASVFVLLALIIALPINTGSFDFSFSVDIFAIIFVLAICSRIRRVPAGSAQSVLAEPVPSVSGAHASHA